MANSATRLLTLIQLLQTRTNQKAADLAAALGVSVRTLHRYMNMLDEMGIPIYTERGPHGGFSLTPGYRMPPLVFTAEEAAVLALGAGLAGELFGSLYADAARAALAKLENVLPESQRQEAAWARRSLVSTGLHRADLQAIVPYLEDLRRAIRSRLRIFIRYGGAGKGGSTHRSVDPYALAFRWGWWYLVGFCHLRRDLRLFRVDRIRELKVLDETFRPPDDFDARVYLEHTFDSSPQIVVRLRFHPEYAFLAEENRLTWDQMAGFADGSIEVSFKVPDAYWGASMALGFGPAAVVVDPPEVQRLTAAWAADVIRQYPPGALEEEAGG